MNIIRLFLILILAISVYAKDYYEILGVLKQANDRDIRKAFKKKALEVHPDKNPFDKNAQENFIELNKAYEVLKNDELRKKYDQYGEEGLNNFSPHGGQYHSWSYYHDNFGIYDDDIEIITLNAADFESSVTGSEDVWFINFYHPTCSHCHTLAPIWRKLAQELAGVVRIGAINCEDTYSLCSNQHIRSYPSLMVYPGAVRYGGEKSKDHLINFILGRLKHTPVYSLTEEKLNEELNKCELQPWLILTKSQFEDDQHFATMKIKIGSLFDGFLCLGQVNCDEEKNLCSMLGMKETSKFFTNREDLFSGTGFELNNLDPQEMAKEVLTRFPDIPILSSEDYKVLLNDVTDSNEPSHRLVIFTEENDDSNLEIRKLPSLLPSFDLSKVRCDRMKKDCEQLFILKTPSVVLFKTGGGYEMHLGRLLAKDIAIFAREASTAPNFQILTPKEFPSCLHDGGLWFVDFYSPWCPPCMRLLPEFRKASRYIDIPVKFGSIDCTVHSSLCRQYNINKYPTTLLYNNSVPHEYQGQHRANDLVDFIKDTVDPKVIVLTDDSFRARVMNKRPEDVWIVDFYANWCGHCVQMAPEYRKFARRLKDKEFVFVAKIDCALYRQLCQNQGVHGYPSIKLFPSGSTDTRRAITFSDRVSRNSHEFYLWTVPFLPSDVSLLDEISFEEMLRSSQPHLVYFYGSRCEPCQYFGPEFEEACNTIGSRVKCAKVNCETHDWLCPAASTNAYPWLVFYGGISGSTIRQKLTGQPFSAFRKEQIINMFQQLMEYRDRESFNNKPIHDEF